LKHKDEIIAGLESQIEDLAAKAKIITTVTADMEHFKEVASDADKSVWVYSMIKAANVGVCVVFVVVFIISVIQVQNFRSDMWDVKVNVHDVQYDVRRVKDSVQNSRGWSVLNGAVLNEETFSQEHPEDYQKIKSTD